MKPGVRLTQRQGTRLTPQLQLAMRLLQCGRTELEHLIEDALAANPVLERVADDGPAHTGDEPLDHGPGHAENGEPPLPAETGAATGDEPDWHGIAEPVSLQSHLNAQLRLSPLGPRDRAIGEALIDGLDADGYCTAGFDDIRAACALQPAPDDAEIETVRHLIQRFDPLAVASRTLSECLLLQLHGIDAEPAVLAAARRIADAHLDVLARQGVLGAAKALGLAPDLAGRAVAVLKTLDPRPGAALAAARTEYIEPDLIAERDGTRWRVRLLDGHRPRLRVNAGYGRRLRAGAAEQAVIGQYRQEAQWLVAALAQRRDTLRRVAEAVVRRQTGFLEQGLRGLRAMRLQDVAGDLGLHESTVSRACNGKYLATPHGLFELSALFASGVADGGDGLQAADAVQARIAELIGAEDPAKPLSDAAIAQRLAAEGVSIARRTVAKYRDALRIPPASARRESA